MSEGYLVDKRTVRRAIEMVALAGLQFQTFQLRKLAKLVTDSAEHVSFAACALMWDETSQRLSLPVVAGATNSASTSTWEICVSRIDFVVCIDGRLFTFLCVCPPLPMVSNGSQHIYNAIFGHPLMAEIHKFRETLQRVAPVYMEFSEGDGHPANERLFFGRPPDVIMII